MIELHFDRLGKYLGDITAEEAAKLKVDQHVLYNGGLCSVVKVSKQNRKTPFWGDTLEDMHSSGEYTQLFVTLTLSNSFWQHIKLTIRGEKRVSMPLHKKRINTV